MFAEDVLPWILQCKRVLRFGSQKGGFQKVLGEVVLLTVGVLLLTVELLCLQSFEVLLRRTFPL